MGKISKKILIGLSWNVSIDIPDFNKSIIIFAPHTSYLDGFFGKLFLMQTDLNYKFLSKKEFFKFPLKYFFRLYGSIPVSENKEYINEVVDIINKTEKIHIILSPEGQLAKTNHWKKGFYYMAKGANIPITVAYIDYNKKEIGIKGVIRDTSDIKKTMIEVSNLYRNVSAKHPSEFTLDKRFS